MDSTFGRVVVDNSNSNLTIQSTLTDANGIVFGSRSRYIELVAESTTVLPNFQGKTLVLVNLAHDHPTTITLPSGSRAGDNIVMHLLTQQDALNGHLAINSGSDEFIDYFVTYAFEGQVVYGQEYHVTSATTLNFPLQPGYGGRLDAIYDVSTRTWKITGAMYVASLG